MHTICVKNDWLGSHKPMSLDVNIHESLVQQSRDWLLFVIDSTGMTANAIAMKAGVSASNLHKLLKNSDWKHPLSDKVKIKISQATGVPLPSGSVAMPARPGFAEPELVAYRTANEQPSFRAEKNGQDIWTIQTAVLDVEGYLPGDHVITDLNVTPHKGDIVVAQIYNDRGTAETVFRKYVPPFLLASTTRREDIPEAVLVDNKRVTIMAVVLRSWRDRDQHEKRAS